MTAALIVGLCVYATARMLAKARDLRDAICSEQAIHVHEVEQANRALVAALKTSECPHCREARDLIDRAFGEEPK